MTVIEQILEAVGGLDERRQREVLELARTLAAEPDVSLVDVDLSDPAAAAAWRERMRTRARLRVAEAMARFRALGLVDADGRIVERELPEDMKADSRTSVGT